jgi:hypothetical protein
VRRLDPLGQAQAVLPGQADVHEDEVRLGGCDLAQRFLAVARLIDFSAWQACAEHAAQGLPKRDIILHYERS